MRRIMLIVFTLVTSTFAFGQTPDKQAAPEQAQCELIALSRQFVDSAIAKEIIVLDDASGSTLIGAPVANVRGKWRSVDLENIEIRIDGSTAVVTGRVAFKGQTTAGRALDNNSNVTISFQRKKGLWKLVNGCLGKCD